MQRSSFLFFVLATTAWAWDGEYLPGKGALPREATPAWHTRVSNPGTEVRLENNLLRIDTSAVVDGRLAFEQKKAWNGLPGSEVEVEVRVVQPIDENLSVAQIVLSGPQGWQSLSLARDYVIFTGKQPKYPLDLSRFQKLHLRLTGEGTVELRVNDVPNPVLVAPLVTEGNPEKHSLVFGDNSRTPKVGGVVEWKAVRWKKGE